METVACCWCHNSGGGGGGNSAIVDYDGCESYRPESRRSGLEELLRNQLTRYSQGVGEVRCGRCEIRQQGPMHIDSMAPAWKRRPQHEQAGSRKAGTGAGTGLGKRSNRGLSFRRSPA